MTESRIEARIRELGYELPVAPAPVAAYVPAVTSGSYVYTSGQLPFVDGALPETGKVSDSGAEGFVTPENAKKYAGSQPAQRPGSGQVRHWRPGPRAARREGCWLRGIRGELHRSARRH